ncbi:MAG: MBL fold metallo-hydrolase [Akkermansiaceae bacterium]|nr:MBL fold metallo-hydrolase [Armatimonadota bacterium]
MNASEVRFTLVGGPTVVMEIGPLRFLTDPTFDAAGGEYDIGVATLHKTQSPALPPSAVGAVDAVLLSHDQHADNLDTAGRALLPSARYVLTTVAGAERLLLPNVRGMAPWQSVEVSADNGGDLLTVRVTATPARHGPEGIEMLIGDVTGFVLEWEGAVNGGLYVSGDTVWYAGVAEIAERFPHVATALLFLGGVRRSEDEPLLTMDAAQAVHMTRALGIRTVIPVHYAGWQHFVEGREQIEQVFADAALSESLLWLQPGEPRTVTI